MNKKERKFFKIDHRTKCILWWMNNNEKGNDVDRTIMKIYMNNNERNGKLSWTKFLPLVFKIFPKKGNNAGALNPVCFCVSKALLKKIKKFLFFIFAWN